MLAKNKLTWMAPLLLAAVVLAACVQAPAGQSVPDPAPTPTPAQDDAQMQSTVDNLRKQLAAQLQVEPGAVEVIAAEAVQWPDACLGAAVPAESCALVVTPGYRVTLAVAGQTYVYHTDIGPYWMRLVEGPQADVGAPIAMWTGAVDNGSCQDAVLGSAGVAFGYCGGGPKLGGKYVSPARLATLAALGARYAPFDAVTDSGTITFMGTGDRTATPEEQLWLASWAQTVVMEAASGVSMTTLEWDLGPTDDMETTCMRLAVLTRGEAYAETRLCAGGDAQDLVIGWLEPAELEQLSTWLRDFAPLTAENGYVAGTGTQPAGAEELAAVEQWAAAVWLRLWEVTTPSQIGQPDGCPEPVDGTQLFVNTDDGYCVLYPAGYVAEQTAPGSTSLVLGSIMNHTDPRVSIDVTSADGRSLEEVGDQIAADYTGFDVPSGMATVDGEEALVLDNLPGQDLNRRLVVMHGDRVYSFFFTPLGDTDEARARMEAFYQQVLNSFRFLDGEASGSTGSPNDGEAVATDIQYVQALVDVPMFSGQGEEHAVIGTVFAGMTAKVTGVSADGAWWRVICPDDTIGSCWVSADPTMTQPIERYS